MDVEEEEESGGREGEKKRGMVALRNYNPREETLSEGLLLIVKRDALKKPL